MILFKRDPSVPVDVKSTLKVLIVGAIVFSIIMFFLLPFLVGFEPVHRILQIGIPLVAIFFLLDVIF